MLENDSFEKEVLRLEPVLYRISVSILKNVTDAEDAVQNAILIAYEKRGLLKNPDAFGKWLIRILVRCCYKALRHRERYCDIGDDLSFVPAEDNPYVKIEIRELLDVLPVRVRTVVMLHYVEGYSVKEIHRILGIPEGTVKSRLSTARRLLQGYLEET
ncbi:MAG: RNA polymerase sigma factor [Clostridia bacterium]|nr:RNA polymerase sigma factor [Clostridia bacterium]